MQKQAEVEEYRNALIEGERAAAIADYQTYAYWGWFLPLATTPTSGEACSDEESPPFLPATPVP